MTVANDDPGARRRGGALCRAEDACRVSSIPRYDDDSALGRNSHGQHIELCFAADMAQVMLAGRQRKLLRDVSITTLRACVSAAAKRAVAV
eukprot:2898853-Pyramimonas_sp.AAC.1